MGGVLPPRAVRADPAGEGGEPSTVSVPSGASPAPAAAAAPASASVEAGARKAPPAYFTGFTCRRTRRLVQLPSAAGLTAERPDRAWGTPLVVRRLTELGTIFRAQFPDAPPLRIGDISTRWAGRLPGHRSHCSGQDVDIRIAPEGEGEPASTAVTATPATGETLDLERIWFVLAALFATCDVEFVFLDRELQRALRDYVRVRHHLGREELSWLFQYPHRDARGLMRHVPNHRRHLHVRFRPERAILHGHEPEMLCLPPAGNGAPDGTTALAQPASVLGAPAGSLAARLLAEHRRLLAAARGTGRRSR